MAQEAEDIKCYIMNKVKDMNWRQRLDLYDDLREWVEGKYEHEVIMGNFNEG